MKSNFERSREIQGLLEEIKQKTEAAELKTELLKLKDREKTVYLNKKYILSVAKYTDTTSFLTDKIQIVMANSDVHTLEISIEEFENQLKENA